MCVDPFKHEEYSSPLYKFLSTMKRKIFNQNITMSNRPKFIPYAVGIIILAFLALVVANSTFLTINSGEKGVLFKKFSGGLDVENIYGDGFHIVAPWNSMFVYDVRVNEDFEKMQVLSSNGLEIAVELSFRYQPSASEIGYLHAQVGPDYLKRIVVPEIRSATREVIGKYLPEELYSTKRESIQTEIYERTTAATGKKFVNVDAVLIRDIELPEKVRGAIEEKIEAEQAALKYDYIKDQEVKEAEIKVIQAQAKADANKILNESLTDKILKDKGIEATLELARSPNSKVVVVGGGGDGLPLILGNQ